MSLAAGTKLGPYEVVGLLGAGGMGEVYRARDARLKREVAIKVLPASFSADADRLRRFEQEAQTAGGLNHPNITAVYDLGAHDGSPYIVTELLEGETLRARLSGGALPVRKATDYAIQIAKGLAAAHEKGIVHRDLKPENLFVTNDGRVKILDFGLAKLTQKDAATGPQTNLPTAGTEPGVVLGTLGYMAPEQVKGKGADQRSDLFSFGAILYEMLSGRRAFHRDSAAETMSAILREEPPDLSATNHNIQPGLERIVRHCLEKNPEERFYSARDVAFDLEALSDHVGPGDGAPRGAGRPDPAFLDPPRGGGRRDGARRRRGGVASRFARPAIVRRPRSASSRSDAARSSRRGLPPTARPSCTRRAGTASRWRSSSAGPRAPSRGPSDSSAPKSCRSRRRATWPCRSIAAWAGPSGEPGRSRSSRSPAAPRRRDILKDVEWADWGPDGKSLAIVRTVPGGCGSSTRSERSCTRRAPGSATCGCRPAAISSRSSTTRRRATTADPSRSWIWPARSGSSRSRSRPRRGSRGLPTDRRSGSPRRKSEVTAPSTS